MSENSRSRIMRWASAAVLFVSLAAGAARADTIVLQQSALIGGTQTSVAAFAAPGAGTLTVTLTDLAWPTRLTTLTFALSTATSVLGTMNGAGTQSFTVGGAANLFAHVYGVTSTPLDLGLYSLSVNFTPVPLPSAAVLLLAGMGLFAAARDRRWRALAPQPQPQPA